MMRASSAALLALLFFVISCGPEVEPLPRQGAAGPPPDDLRQIQLPLTAPCTINVTGSGAVSIEDEYVANVVACENGNAPMEALKAQAVQARGYLYYVMLVTGQTSIGDSQSDQVFSCSYTTAGPRHYEAARATRGQYLAWDGHIIAPFYVAAAIPANQSQGTPEAACSGVGGTDPTNTEKWVTYNLGKSGCNIDMTPLGWIPAGSCTGNPQNRGCASQNGQACLASRGRFYDQMLPYYYGDDIEIAQATGSCGGVSTQAPNYDAYCMNHDQPSYCVDPTQRVICDGDRASQVEDCVGGCVLGECLGGVVEEDDCADENDGWHCLDASTRVHCQAGELSATETCSAGCEASECTAAPGENQDPGDGENPDGENPEDEDQDKESDGDSEHDDRRLESGENFGELLTTSPGIEGGCSQSGSPGGGLPAAILLAAGLFISSRRAGRRRLPDRE